MNAFLTPSGVFSTIQKSHNAVCIFGPESRLHYHSPLETFKGVKPEYVWITLSDKRTGPEDVFTLTMLDSFGDTREEFSFEAKFATAGAVTAYMLRLRRVIRVGKEMSYEVAELRSTKFPEGDGKKQLRIVFDKNFKCFNPDLKPQSLLPRKGGRQKGSTYRRAAKDYEEDEEEQNDDDNEEVMPTPKERQKRSREENEIVIYSSESEEGRVSPPRKALKDIVVEVPQPSPETRLPISSVRQPEAPVPSPAEPETPAVDLGKEYRKLMFNGMSRTAVRDIEKHVYERFKFDPSFDVKKIKVTVTIEEF